MRFSYYGGTWRTGPTLEELLELAKEGDLFARAEESGSEGCYVEVARWKQGDDCHTGQWQRFAFEKFFGGEDLTAEERDSATGLMLSPTLTAQRIADRINAAAGNAFVRLVHLMPTWEESS